MERNELPDLHGRAAQARKPRCQSARIGSGKERAAKVAPLASRESAEPLCGGADRELPRRDTEAGEPAEAGLRNRSGCRFAHRAVCRGAQVHHELYAAHVFE